MAHDLRSSYAALEISEKSYRGIFENVTEGIYQSETAADGSYFTKANPAMAHLLGYATPEEVIQGYSDLNTQLFVDPSDRIRFVNLLRERQSVSGFECRLKKRTGEPIWVAIGARLIVDKGRTRYTIEGTMVDISDRKAAEEDMLRLGNLLTNMMDAMPSVLVAVDAEVRVTQWNREAEGLTGIPADRAQGSLLGEVFPQIADQMGRIRDAIAHRPFEPQDTMALTVNGEKRINDIIVYPLSAEGVEGAVIRLDDVTDRIRMKEMMIQSEKMLSVGGLAAGMAHEINNPLAGILQNTQVIENRLLGQLSKNDRTAAQCGVDRAAMHCYLKARRIPEMLASVSDSGRRAARIVDNMLSFARKGDSKPSSIDLAALMDLTLELAENDYDLKKRLDFRHIRVHKQYDSTLPPVPGNSSKIQQVFLNLLRNGAQAMAARPDRGDGAAPPAQFNLRILKRAEMARIEIQDNGPGMDEDTCKRVFEPFFTTKNVGVGTGLGLSVSYFIITENHKGSLTVMSEPGKGSTFVIELPMNPS
jgi:PAS domain S-box-containing protein